MPTKNRVIWREGLFIKPQHFQQQQRHNDYQLQRRITALTNYTYGFHSLQIDQELLKLGRIGLTNASGSMADGTVFDIPYQDCSPKPLDVLNCNDAASRDIYLALPMLNDTINEVASPHSQLPGRSATPNIPMTCAICTPTAAMSANCCWPSLRRV